MPLPEALCLQHFHLLRLFVVGRVAPSPPSGLSIQWLELLPLQIFNSMEQLPLSLGLADSFDLSELLYMVLVHLVVLLPLLFGAYFWRSMNQLGKQVPVDLVPSLDLFRQRVEPSALLLFSLGLAPLFLLLRAASIKSSAPPLLDIKQVSVQYLVAIGHIK